MKYGKKFLETEQGKRIYNIYYWGIRRGGCCEEWQNFDAFCDWVLKHWNEDAYAAGRVDTSKPFSPDNFRWKLRSDKSTYPRNDFKTRWNETVNKIRAYYGMEPLVQKQEQGE